MAIEEEEIDLPGITRNDGTEKLVGNFKIRYVRIQIRKNMGNLIWYMMT
jgi:hypothetical protein